MDGINFLPTRLFFLFIFSISVLSCKQNADQDSNQVDLLDGEKALFRLLSQEQTGIIFNNKLNETVEQNVFLWQYFYNGGGAAIGDINNDGLSDIYFTGNQVADKLYLNKGDLHFEDISAKAGIDKIMEWKTGVSMVDINEDGWLDIYVCRSGFFSGSENRRNLLYINNGNLTFTESAKNYGLDDDGYSVQAAFLDYDHDGDLDAYVMNHPGVNKISLTERLERMKNPMKEETDHFYRNNGDNTFSDVSTIAGIREFGHGLGIVIIDANQDGWDDVFVANDYQTPDYLFINNRNGTFTDQLKNYFTHCSYFSMGTDAADFNSDGFIDLVCVEMLPEDYEREVQNLFPFTEPTRQLYEQVGFFNQYFRNQLYINNGNNTFRDIAQLAGIDATDWSWSPLLADFDHDGIMDFFTSCGYYQETQWRDWLIEAKKIVGQTGQMPIDVYHEKCPRVKLGNIIYQGNGSYLFVNMTKQWGIEKNCISNGSAMGDLDSDGDLDIVVNNMDDPAFVYENQAAQQGEENHITIHFKGSEKNRFGLGTKVAVYTDSKRQFQSLQTVRGFQSSSDYSMDFGIGKADWIDKIEITWYDGKQQLISNIQPNQDLEIDYQNATAHFFDVYPKQEETTLFTDITGQSGIDFIHSQKPIDDYRAEPFIPQKFSQVGPAIATGDLNADGTTDFFISNNSGFSSALFFQIADGKFIRDQNQAWLSDSLLVCNDAVFLDADLDGDQDLYLATGTNLFGEETTALEDRLMLNNGKGVFAQATKALPPMPTYSSCVDAADFDRDGDLDLFVGGKYISGHYGDNPRSYLLQNEGGRFSDITKNICPALVSPGMVTDAVWTDFNGDGWSDLIVIGEFMDISIFKNNNGKLELIRDTGLKNTSGFWNTIVNCDLDADGDQDYVLGNAGMNSKYTAVSELPLKCYIINCFNAGFVLPVFARTIQGKDYPLRTVSMINEFFPDYVTRKFSGYADYAKKEVESVFGKAEKILYAYVFESSVMMNEGNEKFILKPLPVEAQFSSVNAISVNDFDRDGTIDLLIAGNTFNSPIDIGDADAGISLFLKGKNSGEFEPLSVLQSGFFAPGMVRDLVILPQKKSQTVFTILVANNNNRLQIFQNGN